MNKSIAHVITGILVYAMYVSIMIIVHMLISLMNSRIIKPLSQFLVAAKPGVYICDFQFMHINYVNQEVACSINAGINYNNTTFIILVEE